MQFLFILLGLSFGFLFGVFFTALLFAYFKPDFGRKKPKYVPIGTKAIKGELHLGVSKTDIQECQNSHLPGDCPLCGAN